MFRKNETLWFVDLSGKMEWFSAIIFALMSLACVSSARKFFLMFDSTRLLECCAVSMCFQFLLAMNLLKHVLVWVDSTVFFFRSSLLICLRNFCKHLDCMTRIDTRLKFAFIYHSIFALSVENQSSRWIDTVWILKFRLRSTLLFIILFDFVIQTLKVL